MTLRVTVEIIPFGNEEEKREIGRLDISNITYDRSWENDYGEIASYVVRGHQRSSGFWPLIQLAISQLRTSESTSRV